MLIYCDRLTLGVCARAVWLRRRARTARGPCDIRFLDSVAGSGWHRTLKATMKLLGFTIKEAHFADCLVMPTGEAVSLVARRWSSETAWHAAERILASSPLLSGLNCTWGRNTIRLHLAKTLWASILEPALRVIVATALARKAGTEDAILLVRRPHKFDPALLGDLCPKLNMHFYNPVFSSYRNGRMFLLLWLLHNQLVELKWRLETLAQRLLSRRSPSPGADTGSPSILLLHEDDLSMDRSYRTQPHWLFEDEGPPPFQTYILGVRSVASLPIDTVRLNDYGIMPVSAKEAALTRKSHPPLPVQQRLNRDFRACVLKSVFGRSSEEVLAASSLGRLFFTASRLTGFCYKANIKAFMTCENYYTEADAMQLVAPVMGINTLSYQYSNIAHLGPLLTTNADTVLTFSSLYHDRWTKDGIRPRSFVDIGYLYDTSFQLVRERAGECRSRLEEAGASFIICYFDETVLNDKYSAMSIQDYYSELLALMRLVLDDPSVGLVVKSQFRWLSPDYLDEISAVRESAEATGRYAELIYGAHRNIVFPAEAALCADLAIGHAVGATAALEASLAGTRCILINPYGITGPNDALYAQADIVYPSLVDALDAICAFRAGAQNRQSLGDWSAIIHQFDPFRDGQAGYRMRSLLEQAARGDGVLGGALTPSPNRQ